MEAETIPEAPKVSVVLIVRNGESTLPLAVASLQAQTLSDWECVVVDDASEDSTPDILSSLRDPRFRIYRSEESLGRGGARGLALRHVRGDYIATLDCDDFFFEESLQKHVELLDARPDIAASTGGIILFDHSWRATGRPRGLWGAGERYISPHLSHIRLGFGATVIRRTLLGGEDYDRSYRRSEDRELFSRILRGRKVYIFAETLYAYRWEFQVSQLLPGLHQNQVLYSRLQASEPLRAWALVWLARLKIVFYELVEHLGLESTLGRFRRRALSRAEEERFQGTLSSLWTSLRSEDPGRVTAPSSHSEA